MARLLALSLFCCGCRSPGGGEQTPPAELGAGSPRAGATIRTDYYLIRASLPEECAPPDRSTRSAATRRVGIHITLEPSSDAQVPANPYYARLVDAEGNVYEATLGGCGNAPAPALPARGQAARGWVVFELPRAARPVTLLYTPEILGASKAELAIELR
jgi:hypothetical protein